VNKLSKDIHKFTFSLIATNLFQMIIAQISLAIATNNSIVSLGGVNTIQSLLFSFGGILGAFSFSLNIKSAKAIGENNYPKYQSLLKSSIIINILLGLFFFVLIVFGGRFFLKTVFGFHGEILEISSCFLLIMSPYLLLTLLMFLLTNVLKIEHKTHWIFLISAGTAVIDLILNYVLVAILSMSLFPLYELTKISLQSLSKETFVLKCTILVNGIIILGMLVGRATNLFAFLGLYMLYGVNILVLGILFLWQCFRLLSDVRGDR